MNDAAYNRGDRFYRVVSYFSSHKKNVIATLEVKLAYQTPAWQQRVHITKSSFSIKEYLILGKVTHMLGSDSVEDTIW